MHIGVPEFFTEKSASFPVTEPVNVASHQHYNVSISVNINNNNNHPVAAPKKRNGIINHSVNQIKKIHKVLKSISVILLISTVAGCIVLALLWMTPILKSDDPVQLPDCIMEVNGDGICDDKQNIPECANDGLDCCLLNSFGVLSLCVDCECHLGRYLKYFFCRIQ
jgi:hypothetical protein